MVVNFLGAHSVPKGSTAEEATNDVVNNQLPKLKELRDKGEISPELIDVFLEKGVFDGPQTKYPPSSPSPHTSHNTTPCSTHNTQPIIGAS